MMFKKKLFFLLNLLILMLFSSDLTAGNASLAVKEGSAPRYKISNYPARTKSLLKWIILDLEYDMPKKNSKNGRFQYIEGLFVKWQILTVVFPDNNSKRKKLGLLEGTTTFEAVACDGETHKAEAFVAPLLINRYFSSKGFSQIVTKSCFRALVCLPNGKVIAASEFKGNGFDDSISKSGLKTSARNRISGLIRAIQSNKNTKDQYFPKAILSRNKTPWSFLNYDEFDLIKEDAKK